MLRLFEILTEIGAVIATVMLFMAFAADSAPRQGAIAAMALCFVVIPYCVLGAFQRRAVLDRMPKPTDTTKAAKNAPEFEPLGF